MPDVTRDALEEWDEEVCGIDEELSGMFGNKPPILQFEGSDLHPRIVGQDESILDDLCSQEDMDHRIY